MVFVSEGFLSTTHGKLNCIACHGGNPDTNDKVQAHVDIVADPSEEAETYCAGCHAGIVDNFANSLHKTQHGYYKLFEDRAGFDLRNDPHLSGEFDNECGKCHTTCGQCHISRPNAVKGGFTYGHVFKKTPNMTNNCTACHGSRVGAEYLGENVGFSPDVHWTPNAKRCEFCHTGAELHGNGQLFDTRYDDRNTLAPECEDCHSDVKEANLYHTTHWANAENNDAVSHLSCQVCHAQDYKSCNSCHVGGAGITGDSYMDYKIGVNPLKSSHRPYDYVVLRHIPISDDTFEPWGVASLANYSSLPTWKYATPHNIQRWTSRTDTTDNASCWGKCHNNWVPSLDTYLRETDLLEGEIEANQSVLMPVK
jgi:hypothetical protein